MRFTVFSLLLFASLAAAQLPVTNGGTGAATASGARSNLGAAASADVVPSGAIMFIKTGTCPTGWTQESGFIGLYILATTAAAGDVGTTGGSTSYTPAGTSAAPTVASLTAAAQVFTGASTVVPAETVNSLTAAAQTFTGSSATTSGTSAGTPAGTVSQPTFTGNSVTSSATSAGTPAGTNGASATSGNCAATNIAAGTGSLNACKATAPNLTVTAQTFTGSVLATHTHTTTATGTVTQPTFTGSALTTHTHTLTATGTNGTSAVTGTLNSTTITPLGSNATSAVTGTLAPGAFTGTPATIQPPFVKLIPCSKN